VSALGETTTAAMEIAAPPPGPNIARGSLFFAAAHAVALLVSLLGNMALVRIAPPSEIASYLLFVQTVTMLAIVLHLGLANSTLRLAPLARGAGGRDATAKLRRRLLGLQLMFWAIALPILHFAWPPLTRRLGAPELPAVGPAVAGVAAILSLARTSTAYLRAFRRYLAAATLEQLGARALMTTCFVVILVRGGGVSWVALAAIFSVASAASLLAQATALGATTPLEENEPRVAQPPPGSAAIARLAAVIGANGIIAALVVSSDLWILSATRSHAEVALYGMMLRLLQLVTFSPMVAAFVVPQEFSRLHAAGALAELETLARTSATVNLAVAGTMGVGLAVLGRPLIGLLFGPAYVPGWGILMVLVVGRLIDVAAGPAGALLLMTGHQGRVFANTAAAGIGTVALAALLAWLWGGYGVATAVGLGLLAINALNVRSSRRLLGVRTLAFASAREWSRLPALAMARLRGER
jgi:O-antigen/teichoic acid export membrane protein